MKSAYYYSKGSARVSAVTGSAVSVKGGIFIDENTIFISENTTCLSITHNPFISRADLIIFHSCLGMSRVNHKKTMRILLLAQRSSNY